jgi:hypothetical protein
VLLTPGATDLIDRLGITVSAAALIRRHVTGDWVTSHHLLIWTDPQRTGARQICR